MTAHEQSIRERIERYRNSIQQIEQRNESIRRKIEGINIQTYRSYIKRKSLEKAFRDFVPQVKVEWFKPPTFTPFNPKKQDKFYELKYWTL
jgi:hypothetical protein